MKDKIRGALYGVAVGDALGAPLEFLSAREIAAQYGVVKEMMGGGWLNVRPGEITDDTQMTLAVAEGIAANPENPVGEIGARLMDWMASGPKDVGNTCRAAISRAREMITSGAPNDAATWLAASGALARKSGGMNAGNGALMRTVYPALYYADIGDALRVADVAGRMTHDNEMSADACAIYVRMVHLLIAGASMGEAWAILDHTEYASRAPGTPSKASGYVVDSMRCALYCAETDHSFRDTIERAANLGEDADTNAAIAGGLAGALYGFSAIPISWVEALDMDVRKRLDALAETALQSRVRAVRME